MWTTVIAMAILLLVFLAVGIRIGIWRCGRSHPRQWSTTSSIVGTPTTLVEGEFSVSEARPGSVNTRGQTRVRRARIVQGNRRGQLF